MNMKFRRTLTSGLVAAACAAGAAALMAAPSFAADTAAPAPKVTTGTAPAASAKTAPAKMASDMKATAKKDAMAKPAQMPKKAAMEKKVAMHRMSRHRVEQIQTALDNHGQNVPIDGIWGHKTMMAVKAFQKDHDLRATGRLDHATWKALNKSA